MPLGHCPICNVNILDEARNFSIFFLKLQIPLKKKKSGHKESQTSCLWESSVSIKAPASEQATAKWLRRTIKTSRSSAMDSRCELPRPHTENGSDGMGESSMHLDGMPLNTS